MKKFYIIPVLVLMCFANKTKAQTGHQDNFEQGLSQGWNGGSHYQLSVEDNQLKVVGQGAGPGYESFYLDFPESLDLSENPYVQFKIKSNSAFILRVDLRDDVGNTQVTNRWPIKRVVRETEEFTEYFYDFSGKFRQSYPNHSDVSADRISRVEFLVNPNREAFEDTFYIDDLRVGSEHDTTLAKKRIRLNQIGFYPEQAKRAVVVSPEEHAEFKVINVEDGEEVYSGNLEESRVWNPSQELVGQADFSALETPGRYKLYVEGIGNSYEFSIKEQVHHGVLRAALRSYYLQRASIPIEEAYAGIYARPAGHPDLEVKIHSSAADASRPAEYEVSSPGGWYDAGDYGKYVVNSGISTYSLLSAYENYPDYFDTLDLGIPKMQGVPDLLNEALYNIRWMLTMQDPNDGGVYHKLTSERHDGHFMPHEATFRAGAPQRYMFRKSTAATLNFSAIMAQSYRIFNLYEDVLPGLADSCINASLKAYHWAVENPEEYFKNPSDHVTTGQYADENVEDEFSWASAELLVSTRDEQFAERIVFRNIRVPSWQNTGALAITTLNKYIDQMSGLGISSSDVRSSLVNATMAYEGAVTRNLSAYRVAMGARHGDFVWGSNAYAGNQGLILLETYHNLNNQNYFNAALANLDYLLGRNGVGYSFVTNYGSMTPANPHHRISANDGIALPVPGLVVGGPQVEDHEGDGRCPKYPSDYPGAAYHDLYCSFSTNENAINYNSAFVALCAGIEAIEAGAQINRLPLPEPRKVVLDTDKPYVKQTVKVYPNPVDENLSISFYSEDQVSRVQVLDATGKVHLEENISGSGNVQSSLNVSRLNPGVYIINLSNGSGIQHTKFVKQ
ncbi:glycoside hydrolase family 9 protein [Cytophagaceae bacterium ABcell3]|nr:glycoside hydrolase family 9 protein [Cytophagaceae bacterium ABcell3]